LDMSELFFGKANETDTSGSTRIYEQYVCGAQKLCSKLGINPSIVAYRSIMAAVYQLGSYAHPGSSFGSAVVTLLLPPPGHFGFAVGLTIIANDFISTQHVRDIAGILFEHFKSLQSGDLNPITSVADQQRMDVLLHYYGLRYLHTRQNDIPAEIVSSISKKV